jgi:tetratricopeptide (TPR) repeat protein
MTCPNADSILAFVEGALSETQRLALVVHLDACESCLSLVGGAAGGSISLESRRSSGVRLAKGTSVGRYILLDLVGSGGMGDVYEAYDPKLGRRVAIKVMSDRVALPASAARFTREAQAIARLSHPNVVAIYDAGEFGDRVYLAMEFVEGRTLTEWLAAEPHTSGQIRDVFLAAGRGLAAAHEAGLVHRDFKPPNVMVGRDGSVRVMDFGLAADMSEVGPTEAVTDETDGNLMPSSRTLALTRGGVLLGTPLYMAPEQFEGRKTDARTDQFSFCVALYQALYESLPFEGDCLATLKENVCGGRVREPAPKTQSPTWLWKLLLRGLHVDREQRFPSMRALLKELARDPERRRRQVMVGVSLAALLLAGGAIGQQSLARSNAPLCRGAAVRLNGIWELPATASSTPRSRRESTRAAFLATGIGMAGSTWQETASILDGYAQRWSAMSTEACEATHVRGEQSSEVLDLRMNCLNDSREHLRALVDLFASADPTIVGKAVSAASSLPDLNRCADVAVLRAVVAPPRDPAVREHVADIRRRASEIRALAEATARYGEALALADPLVSQARSLGYEPLVAEVLALRAWIESLTARRPKMAAQDYEEALWAAEATRHDQIAAEAAVEEVAIFGFYFRRFEDGERWGHLADAILKRMGPGHARLRGWLAHNRGWMHNTAGELERAQQDFLTAIAVKQAIEGENSIEVASSMTGLADTYAREGNFAAAADEGSRADAIFLRTDSVDLHYAALSNRCEYLNGMHRNVEALQSCTAALSLMEADRPPAPVIWHAHALTVTGVVLIDLGRPDEAIPYLRRALEMRGRADLSALDAETSFALACALWNAHGSHVEARAAAESARRGYASSPHPGRELREVEAWLAAHPAPPKGSTVRFRGVHRRSEAVRSLATPVGYP